MPALRLLASGFLDLTFHPTGERETATVSLFRDAAGSWRLVIWPGVALLPVVVEGDEPTPCADALLAAMFGRSVLSLGDD